MSTTYSSSGRQSGSGSGSSSLGTEYMEIIPFQRITELEYFYTSDSVKNDKVIEVVDLKEKKKFSEEVQGQYALDQLEATLDVLRVKQFVIPTKDKGGCEIPEVPSREDYFNAHVEAKSKTVTNIMDSQAARGSYLEVLKRKMEKARGRRNTMFQTMEQNAEDNEDNENQRQSISFEDEKDIDKVNDEFENAYAKWNREQQAQNDDMLRQEAIIENCRKYASKQHDDDADAVNRLLSALFALKKFIQNLIKKFPFLSEIVRTKRADGIDPYDDNDMRTCYVNLLDRYRQSDEKGILTTTMSGMGEKQGGKSLSAFLLSVEDWHQTMIRMGVQSISISDLAAIITLKGMNENYRIEFLQQEAALELTLDALEQEDELNGEDGMSTGTSAKKDKKTLLVRVKNFIQQDKNKRLINQRLSGGTGVSSDTSPANARKEAEEKLKEAQNVFAATVDKAGTVVCQHFSRFGSCRFGSGCRYKHETSQEKEESAKRKKAMDCYQWRDYGTCKFGDKCAFKHGPNKGAEQVAAVKQEEDKKETKNSKVTNTLFSVDDKSQSWGNSEESVKCILASSEMTTADEKVMNVNSGNNVNTTLGWDTMASIHVAKDGSENQLANLNKLQTKRSATGLAGSKPITHSGYNTQFDLHMHVIPGGNTPNIKSVGKSLQTDGDGTEYVAIFTARGATQMSLTERSKQQIMQILNEASENDNIVGTAIQKNGVYEESFGEEYERSEISADESAFAVTSMYTHRVPMSSADDIIGMLVSACVKEEHLIEGIKSQSIKGLPECVTVDAVSKYFKVHGKDKDIIMAEISNAPLRTPIDYEKEVYTKPGEHIQMDNVDPSFARVKGEKTPISSIGGYRDAVVAMDNSGYSVVHGREKKKNPHMVVKRFIDKWKAKWNSLKKLSADKEFITEETMRMCEQENIKVRQAVPYDHRRGLGGSEGLNRWLQDCAQAHMNRLSTYVHLGLITEHDKRTLWFHALQYANDVKMLAPSKTDPTKTQFEEGEKVKFNLSTSVLLPFGMRVVIRKKSGDQDGRGIDGIYVGFSKVVAGGVLVYVLATKRVVQKYTFVPREPMPVLSDIDCEYAATALYGDLQVDSTLDNSSKSKVGGDKLIMKQDPDMVTDDAADVVTDVVTGMVTDVVTEMVTDVVTEMVKGVVTAKKKVTFDNPHFTRSKKIREVVLHVSSERPPKPKLPSRHEAVKSDRWKKAYRREIVKINEEAVMIGLSQTPSGKYIRPANAIVMKLLAIMEWKWKVDPDTDVEGWLECVRIVCDGSADKREGENTYAETPDRTLLFLMISIEATLGIKSKIGDAVRAYLNAPSLDKNLVVIADEMMTSGEGMERFDRESLLLKALYGSIKGAISFQVWADMKLAEINYLKCDVARGVYIKTIEDEVVRLYRHSDDFKISTSNNKHLDEEVEALQGKIRTTPFKPLSEFLGCTFARFDSKTMVKDETGDIQIVTMISHIEKMEKDYGHLRKHMNPTGRVRHTPFPLKPVLCDHEMTELQKQLIPEQDIKEYMSMVMSVQWVVQNVRPNLRFCHHVLAKRMSNPRVWDVYLSVWLLEHMILTKNWPLVLGGSVVDPEVHTDASFASMEERRSICGHTLRSGDKSGVVRSEVRTLKVAVTSVFEAENMGASDGMDTEMYANRVVDELQYPSLCSRKVYVDNTAAIDWMLGSVPSKRSKHMEVRLFRSRHLVARGDICMEYVPTKFNIADLLTKSLPRQDYERLSKMMLGHELIAPDLRYWEI